TVVLPLLLLPLPLPPSLIPIRTLIFRNELVSILITTIAIVYNETTVSPTIKILEIIINQNPQHMAKKMKKMKTSANQLFQCQLKIQRPHFLKEFMKDQLVLILSHVKSNYIN